MENSKSEYLNPKQIRNSKYKFSKRKTLQTFWIKREFSDLVEKFLAGRINWWGKPHPTTSCGILRMD